MKTLVMFVDDDAMLLSSTRRQLKMKLPHCEFVFFDNAMSALDAMQQRVPDIVFSDVRMPEIDGPEFLRRVSVSHPEVVRFAWTGQSEASQFEGVFRVALQVLTKPCPTERLIALIDSVIEFRREVAGSWLLPKFTQMDRVAIENRRLQAIIQLVNSPNASIQSLAGHIDESPILKARLLGLANSPFFAPSVAISQTHHAMTMIGLEMVKAILLAFEMNAGSEDNSGFPAECSRSALDQGVRVGMRVAELSRSVELSDDEKNAAMIAAVFHQYGVIQFAIHGGEDYEVAFRAFEEDPESLIGLEQQTFSTSRFAAAAYCLAVLGMDTAACRAIASLDDRKETECKVSTLLKSALEEVRSEKVQA